jgi:peptidoglycan/xylan/chitin deacetylase (PgdA/CDA1 family)
MCGYKVSTLQPKLGLLYNQIMKKIALILLILIGLILVAANGIYKLMNARTYQTFGEIYPRVETMDKVVALTFDDGPTENYQTIIDMLHQRNVKATFFVIGQDIEKNKDAARSLVEAGHQLGNHSYSHQRMIFKSQAFVKEEIEKTDALIREVGFNPNEEIVFRPPYGKKLFALPMYLAEHNRKTITWDLEPNVYLENNASTEDIVSYVVEHTEPGSIILLHPWYDNNEALNAIPGIVDTLQKQGYRFVTINELLNLATLPEEIPATE